MATEEGIVIKPGRLDGSTMWVRTTRSSACKACSARNSCKPEENTEEMEVEAVNAANAVVGDRIVLSFKTTSLLKATFLLYIFPVLCMIGGAFIGQMLAEMNDYNASIGSAVTAFLFFGLSFRYIRVKGNKLAEHADYKPRITRIMHKVSSKPPISSGA
ncbi:MAG: SoxR reducing system RseC family protein [Desulfobacteraceae bacterium]|nr:SoxR reducing system RseC family protein [Desulfobacteraceae bacterium]